MIRRPPRSTRTDTLFPYTTLFRSIRADIVRSGAAWAAGKGRHHRPASVIGRLEQRRIDVNTAIATPAGQVQEGAIAHLIVEADRPAWRAAFRLDHTDAILQVQRGGRLALVIGRVTICKDHAAAGFHPVPTIAQARIERQPVR